MDRPDEPPLWPEPARDPVPPVAVDPPVVDPPPVDPPVLPPVLEPPLVPPVLEPPELLESPLDGGLAVDGHIDGRGEIPRYELGRKPSDPDRADQSADGGVANPGFQSALQLRRLDFHHADI